MTRFAITLTAMQQKALTLALTLSILTALMALVYSFVAAQWEHHNRVALLARELSARRALVEQAPVWQERLARLRASSQWQQLLVSQPTLGLPSPVGQLVTRYGGSLGQHRATQFDTGTAVELDEEAHFTADMTTLAHVLYDMRSSEPLLVIRRLTIADTEAIGQKSRTTSNKLYVDMTVAGFMAPK
jgi:hypothetical protein